MGLVVLVRPERAADLEAIRAVVAAAFGRQDEARLVELIRRSPDYIPDLALVAEDRGAIPGHVMFSRTVLIDGDAVHPVLALAPVSVVPDRQRAGIGTALVREGIARADARGEPLVVVLGHPAYYPRFGFEPASQYGVLKPSPDIPDAAFMILPLSGYDPPVRGRVQYSEAFGMG